MHAATEQGDVQSELIPPVFPGTVLERGGLGGRAQSWRRGFTTCYHLTYHEGSGSLTAGPLQREAEPGGGEARVTMTLPDFAHSLWPEYVNNLNP